VLNANLATFGLVAADLTPLTNARNDFQTKLGNFQTAEAAFCAASEAEKDRAQHRRTAVSADGAAHQPPPPR
jgi:hypothetical protein